jgi:hypothetical protein
MKRTLLLLCATMLVVAAPLAPARADDSVPIDFFYDALSPYGDWIYTPNYGYVWQPLASQQPGWTPYSDGNWVYTDAGWTWMSNEDFGWLTYHYGRWIRMQQNWFWVPGYEWAPAWVSWRQTQSQIGWAPLPPEAAWVPSIGFGGWTDSYYDVGPAYYNFVPYTAFASASSLRPFIIDRSRNFTLFDQSVNITHTTYQQNAMNQIFVGGPDPQRIDGFGGNQVRRLTLRRDDDGFRRDWLDHRGGGAPQRGRGNPSRIERDQLVIAAPSIRRDASHALPPRVREAFNQPVIDRGWHGGKGAQNVEQLREHQRDELARTRPPNLPDKNVQPVTSAMPPPAIGRALEPHERVGRGGTNPPPNTNPRREAEEVRPAKPVPSNAPPGIPSKKTDVPGNVSNVPQPGMPHRDHRGEGPQPGVKPGDRNEPPSGVMPRNRPGFPQQDPSGNTPPSVTPPERREPQAPPSTPKRLEPQAQPSTPKREEPQTPPSTPKRREPQAPPSIPQRQDPQAPPSMPKRGPNASEAPPGRRGPPGRQGQSPGNPSAERQPGQRPSAPPVAPPSTPVEPPRANPAPMPPPRANPAPMPPAQPQPAPIRPLPPQGGNAPPLTPVAPQPNAPTVSAPQAPSRPGKKH